MAMDPPPPRQRLNSNSLFDVFLRLRPANANAERFLDVEQTDEDSNPTHITIKPPSNDRRKRAVERFAFTRVFEEDAAQLDLFRGADVVPLIEGVIGAQGKDARDGLLATLGVTGSGKSHTILGTKNQRGLIQMTMDVLYQSTSSRLVQPAYGTAAVPSLAAADVSEAQIFTATAFLDSLYGDNQSERFPSRAQTPMPVCPVSPPQTQSPTKISIHNFISKSPHHTSSMNLYPSLKQSLYARPSTGVLSPRGSNLPVSRDSPQPMPGAWPRTTRSAMNRGSPEKKDYSSFISTTTRSKQIPRPSTLPQYPNVDDLLVPTDPNAEYAIIVSMYEVYNDRIFDLLTGSAMNNRNPTSKRRALLFKSTEKSPDRKVVAGLKKIICGSLEEALTVLETGLMERKVAGTGSNAVSSRSHGFFCMEVKKRDKARQGVWSSNTLTIVDLAGSERARNAKTAGATLAEAGKINESLMYLGQCMQMQSDKQEGNKQNIVPFRQCKLTELLFSNSFPSHHNHHHSHRHPQKGIMIVTADPMGDFNATSQILRYSALAREVTVPRIPSVTDTILSGTTALTAKSHLGSSGRTTPNEAWAELEAANAQIDALAEEVEVLTIRLTEETSRRKAAEESWAAAEDRMEEMEQEIRDECFAEMDKMLFQEKMRWQLARDEEADRNDEHMDRKIDALVKAGALGRGVDVYEDPELTANERVDELERENEELRRRLELAEREVQSKSPTKKQRVLKAKRWEDPEAGLSLANLSLQSD